MPRVSEDHLEARRRQIIEAARGCFAANGFHATSMQDILRASGLSAGAVYRYFPGKEDIVAAIAREAVGTIRASFETDDDSLTIGDLVLRALHGVEDHMRINDLGRLALQIWSEAARSPRLRVVISEAVLDARAALRDRIERQHGDQVDAEAVAAVVIAMLPGYVHARVIVGDMDPERFCRGLDDLAGVLR